MHMRPWRANWCSVLSGNPAGIPEIQVTQPVPLNLLYAKICSFLFYSIILSKTDLVFQKDPSLLCCHPWTLSSSFIEKNEICFWYPSDQNNSFVKSPIAVISSYIDRCSQRQGRTPQPVCLLALMLFVLSNAFESWLLFYCTSGSLTEHRMHLQENNLTFQGCTFFYFFYFHFLHQQLHLILNCITSKLKCMCVHLRVCDKSCCAFILHNYFIRSHMFKCSCFDWTLLDVNILWVHD